MDLIERGHCVYKPLSERQASATRAALTVFVALIQLQFRKALLAPPHPHLRPSFLHTHTTLPQWYSSLIPLRAPYSFT